MSQQQPQQQELLLYTPDQLEEVSSWIHDERRCVTTQTVSLTLGVSRSVAVQLLSAIPSQSSTKHTYEIVESRCQWSSSNTNPKDNDNGNNNRSCVFKLTKTTVEGGCKAWNPRRRQQQQLQEETGLLYSLALVESESLWSAHEKDRALYRDLLAEESTTGTPCHALDAANHTDAIAPAVEEPMDRISLKSSRQERIHRMGQAPSTTTPPPFSATATASKRQGRKTTTAASFFGQSTKKPQAKSKQAANTEPSKTEPTVVKTATKTKTTKQKSTNSVSKQAPASKSKTSTKKPKKPVDDKKSVVSEEKENTPNDMLVGNADDFVGDEDEDDDFLREEEERRRRNRERERREQEQAEAEAQRRRRLLATSLPKGRKRRKRLVEKTTMDANGYLRTETHSVWEEVPSDEEQQDVQRELASKRQTKAPQKKKVQHLKQGNLMGFFKKK